MVVMAESAPEEVTSEETVERERIGGGEHSGIGAGREYFGIDAG